MDVGMWTKDDHYTRMLLPWEWSRDPQQQPQRCALGQMPCACLKVARKQTRVVLTRDPYFLGGRGQYLRGVGMHVRVRVRVRRIEKQTSKRTL